MLPTTFRPDAILECLLDNEVRFIVIGGLAAFAQGAGWPTQDADIVVDCAEGNLRRLLIALSELEAEYDTLHRPPIRPNWRLLSGSTGPQLFRTKYGRLDVLKEPGGETYGSLSEDAVAAELHGSIVRCASIDALLRMKRSANRPKDRAGIDALLKRREAQVDDSEKSPERD